MADVVQGTVVALIGAAAAAFVLRQALRRFKPPSSGPRTGCGSCRGCNGGGCGPAGGR